MPILGYLRIFVLVKCLVLTDIIAHDLYDNFTHFLVGNENEPFCFGQNLSLRWVLED